jgi:hypothetical protein
MDNVEYSNWPVQFRDREPRRLLIYPQPVQFDKKVLIKNCDLISTGPQKGRPKAKGEAFSPQKRTSSTSKDVNY